MGQHLAVLPFQRTLEYLAFAFQPSIYEWLDRELAHLAFIAEASCCWDSPALKTIGDGQTPTPSVPTT